MRRLGPTILGAVILALYGAVLALGLAALLWVCLGGRWERGVVARRAGERARGGRLGGSVDACGASSSSVSRGEAGGP